MVFVYNNYKRNTCSGGMINLCTGLDVDKKIKGWQLLFLHLLLFIFSYEFKFIIFG